VPDDKLDLDKCKSEVPQVFVNGGIVRRPRRSTTLQRVLQTTYYFFEGRTGGRTPDKNVSTPTDRKTRDDIKPKCIRNAIIFEINGERAPPSRIEWALDNFIAL
jgi:hypothetical protein